MSAFTPLEEQIRDCFGRVVYAHKTHEKMAEDCAATLRYYKYGQIIASALTALSALIAALSNELVSKVATAILAATNAWLAAYMKNFDPGGTAQKHRDAAASLWPVREDYLSLLTDLRMGSINHGDAIKRRDQLESKLAAVYKGAPQTNAKAYAAAQKALKQNEEYTFSDAEIDKFVPESLRKRKNDQPDQNS